MPRACTILLSSIALFVATTASAAPSRRFALLIGQNDGGADTVKLRYAEADARKLSAILRELGGYRDQDVVSVMGTDAGRLLGAFDQLEARVKEAKEQDHANTILIVYYSGHAKAGELRLGSTRLPMSQLRQRLHDSSADLKLGIIDACESGAITREKGGRRGPSFIFDTDDREAGKGLILITSSAESESSQESDELGGSFFTHYLTSGLRGDADESGDQRVTLGEAYAYTYNKTVSVTANTRSGTQHPTFSYDFKGNGDIILTDLSQGSSGVSFGDALSGDFLIFDKGRDQVAAEIKKEAGAVRKLALPPGEYVVKKRLADHLMMRRFTLAANHFYDVNESAMERVEFQDDYAKGVGVRAEINREEGTRVWLRTLSVYQGFFSSSVRNDLFPALPLFGLAFDVGPFLGAKLGTEVLVGARSDLVLGISGLNLGYDFFEAEVAESLMWSTSFSDFSAAVGPRLAGLYFKRSFPHDDLLSKHTQDNFSLSPQGAGVLAYYPGEDRDFSIELHGRLGFLSFGVDHNQFLTYGEVGLSLGYRL
jgi:hypothetical protein